MDKKIKVLTEDSSRKLAIKANELEIKKDDIVNIIYRDGQFIMFYYQ